jgi:hypothetical protein
VADFFTFSHYELQFPQYLSAEATLPDGFSVAAVPELSTWAMLLIGFVAYAAIRGNSAPVWRGRRLVAACSILVAPVRTRRDGGRVVLN